MDSTLPDPRVWRKRHPVQIDLNGPLDLPLHPWPDGFADIGLYECFVAVAARQPDALAVTDGTTRLSYARMRAEVDRIASLIATQVTVPGAVAMLLPSGPMGLAAILAVVAAGRCCILLNPHDPPARTVAILQDAAPAAVLATADTRVAVQGAVQLDANAVPVRIARPERLAAGATALVIYTSGSTGEPKGYAFTERQLLLRCWYSFRPARLQPDDRFLILNVLSTVAGMSMLLAGLLSGTGMLMTDLPQSGIRPVLTLARDERATALLGIPSVISMLLSLDTGGAVAANLRLVRTTGTRVLAVDVAGWRARLPPACLFYVTYGQTETQASGWFVPPGFQAESATLPSGYIAPDIDFCILGDTLEPVPDGTPGELFLRSDRTVQGEWRNGRCTPGRIRQDPDDPSRRIIRTGDLARLRKDRLLEILGRNDRQVKASGIRIEPAEVEAVMRSVDGVAGAVVLARSAAGLTTLIGFALPAAGVEQSVLEARLRGALRARLPAAMRPSGLHFVSEFPRMPGGKVDEPALLARFYLPAP